MTDYRILTSIDGHGPAVTDKHIQPETHLDHTISKHILARHSTRVFKDHAVPEDILESCLSLAQHAPSNSNLQPWRIHVLVGAGLKRVTDAVMAAVEAKQKPAIAPIPDEYKKYRSEMGHALYGENGYNIARGEKEKMEAARKRNYTFFDAPVGMIISMDEKLDDVDVLSVGLHLQTLCLLLQERGLGSCIEVSIAGYPDEIRKELGIADNMKILCGLAVGYEEDEHNVNKLKMSRDAWKDNVVIVKE